MWFYFFFVSVTSDNAASFSQVIDCTDYLRCHISCQGAQVCQSFTVQASTYASSTLYLDCGVFTGIAMLLAMISVFPALRRL